MIIKLENILAKNNIKGILCIISAALCFSIMSTFVKFILTEHHVIDVMFLRSGIALLFYLFY